LSLLLVYATSVVLGFKWSVSLLVLVCRWRALFRFVFFALVCIWNYAKKRPCHFHLDGRPCLMLIKQLTCRWKSCKVVYAYSESFFLHATNIRKILDSYISVLNHFIFAAIFTLFILY